MGSSPHDRARRDEDRGAPADDACAADAADGQQERAAADAANGQQAHAAADIANGQQEHAAADATNGQREHAAADAANGQQEQAGATASPAAFFEDFRAHRFRAGVRCPHCDHTKIHRHGSFQHRRRYRCLTCRRTFSDLTGTALAYSKKPALWPRYAECAARSLTVRSAAGIVGLSVSTAFRWRHAIMREFVERDDTVLSGSIEFVDLRFAYSEKGRRRLKRPVRLRGVRARSACNGAGVRVVIACDHHDGAYSDAFVTSRVSKLHLLHAFGHRVRSGSAILAAQGPLGPFGSFARAIGATFRDCRRTADRQTRGSPSDVAPGTAKGRRFCAWLTRFCGVATKYLSNYLGWHRLLERRRPPPAELTALGWHFERQEAAV